MMTVKCINANNLTVLEVGATYYAFPVSAEHAYISRFPNQQAHTGCFSLSRFIEVQLHAKEQLRLEF